LNPNIFTILTRFGSVLEQNKTRHIGFQKTTRQELLTEENKKKRHKGEPEKEEQE